MTPKKKIFVTREIPQVGIKKLKDQGYRVIIHRGENPLSKKELAKNVKEIDALLCILTDQIDKTVIEAAGANLKIIANYAVGFDNIDVEAAKRKNIMVTNTPGILTDTVAEHAIALLFSVARRIPEADRFVRAKKYRGWGPMLFLGSGVKGKTLGIIGLGRIGIEVATRMQSGFDMEVCYFDVSRNEKLEQEYKITYEPLESLLKKSDFVSIHAPLSPTTRHLVGLKQLKMMKKTAYLINTSRGAIIDEGALARALKNKWIQGAALDVFEFEPKLVPGITDLDNVVVTPHMASATQETRNKMSEMAADNIIAALSGQQPPNLIR